jgi:hypothetical protein
MGGDLKSSLLQRFGLNIMIWTMFTNHILLWIREKSRRLGAAMPFAASKRTADLFPEHDIIINNSRSRLIEHGD